MSDNIKVDKLATIMKSAILGFCAGAGFTLVLDKTAGPGVYEAVVHQREEGKPSVLTLERSLSADQILVEKHNQPGKFIQPDRYLLGIVNKYDREIERVEIRRAADW